MFKSTVPPVPLSPLNYIAIENNSKGGILMAVPQNKKHRELPDREKNEVEIRFSFTVSSLIRPYSNVYC